MMGDKYMFMRMTHNNSVNITVICIYCRLPSKNVMGVV